MPSLTRTRTIFTALLILVVASLWVTQPAWAELLSFSNTNPGMVSNIGGQTAIINRDVTVSGFAGGETVTKVTITVDFHKVNHESEATCAGTSGNGTSSQNMRLRLIHNPGAGATTVIIVANQGTTTYFGTASNGRVQVTFDDAAATGASGIPTTGTFRPANPLSAFNGLVANTTWRLEIGDAVDDNQGVCFYSYTLNIWGQNDPPVAVNDSYTTNEDTQLNVLAPGVLANDTDPDDDPLSTVLQDYPLNGSLTLNNDGSFLYTPNLDFAGDDTFTYYVFDGSDDSNLVTVTITVNPVNDAPEAVDDAYTTSPDTALVVAAPGVLDNDLDAEGDPLTAALAVGPVNGVLVFGPNGSFTYTPNAGWSGVDTFTYTASDGTLISAPATVEIEVGVVVDDQNPVAFDDAYHTEQDVTLTVDALTGLLANDSDPNGDPITAILGDDPLHGGLALEPDGSFVYWPDEGFVGVDTFTYEVTDGVHYSEMATVTITVFEGGETFNPGGMRARDDTLITGRDTPGVITIDSLFANDTLPAGAVLTSFTQAENGTVESIDGKLIYTPYEGFTGEDWFSYMVSDSLGGAVQAIVHVTVWKPVPACRDIGGEQYSVVYAMVPDAALPTGADVFCRVMVENGEFIRPSGEIGILEVLQLDIIQAVEVFGMHVDGTDAPLVSINGPVTICLQGYGRTLYLSVTGQPRVPQWTESWRENYLTCTTIPDAGTVILVY